MTEKNNDKKKVWIYAVVLFTSAFIVLLLTAVSQIKLNNNIDEYKTQIYTKEKEKSDFQLNLNSSQNENKKLQQELKKVKGEISSGQQVLEEEKNRYREMEELHKKILISYEKLLKAENEYAHDNYVSCATILLKECDVKNFDAEALKRYSALKADSYGKAAKTLYLEGLKKYKSKNYAGAINDFQLSAELNSTDYFSDDCYYYIAYSQYKLGKYDLVEKAVNKLLASYPTSSYAEDVNDLLRLIRK